MLIAIGIVALAVLALGYAIKTAPECTCGDPDCGGGCGLR